MSFQDFFYIAFPQVKYADKTELDIVSPSQNTMGFHSYKPRLSVELKDLLKQYLDLKLEEI